MSVEARGPFARRRALACSALAALSACSGTRATPTSIGVTRESAETPSEREPTARDASPPEKSPATAGGVTPDPVATLEAEPGEPPGIELHALPVPGFLDAVLALPSGYAERPARAATRDSPLPLVVATHGAGGDPRWTCEAWSRRLGGRVIVLCPRGRAISVAEQGAYYYPDHFALGKELLAALAALEEAVGPLPATALYTGYSQGATMGALFLIDHAARFPTLVLTEGGYREWSASRARTFARNGGRRVLFVCGIASCETHAKQSASHLRRAGVETRVEHVVGGGHADWGRVGERLDTLVEWFFPVN